MQAQRLTLLLNLFIRALGIVSGILLAVFVLKEHGVEMLGFFSLLSIYALVFAYIGKFGLDVAFVRLRSAPIQGWENASDQEKYSHSVAFIVVASGIMAILVSILVGGFKSSSEYINRYLPEMIASACIVIPYAITFLNAEGLRSEGNSTAYTFFQGTAIPLLTLLLSFFLNQVLHLQPRDSLIYAFVSAVLISWLYSTFLYKVSFNWKCISANQMYSLGKFTVPFMLNSIAILFLGWTDSLLLSLFDTEAAVGEYNFYLRIANLVFAPVTVIGALFTKLIILSMHEDTRLLQGHIRTMTRYSFLLAWLVAILALGIFPFAKEYFFNKPTLAVNALYWLVAAQVLNAFTGPKDMLMQLIGKEKVLLKAFIVALVVNGALNGLLIPRYSLLGAALANFASMAAWNGVVVIYLQKHANINLLTKW